jgi:hypothetical protein
MSTDALVALFREHHAALFAAHGASPRGVDWNDEGEFLFRYGKMLEVVTGDPGRGTGDAPTLLDVGCGWGGLRAYAAAQGLPLRYAGIDIVPEMVDYGRRAFPDATFESGDFLRHAPAAPYDYLVCNGTLTQKLDIGMREMDAYAKAVVRHMFALCGRGIAFNLMSNRVNFTVPNLFYNSPVEVLAWCLAELSPRVRLDHGYSSLAGGRGKLYDFTVYVYR